MLRFLELFAACVMEGRINSSERERCNCIFSQERSPEGKNRLALMCSFLLLPWGGCGEGVHLWAKRGCYDPNSACSSFPTKLSGTFLTPLALLR